MVDILIEAIRVEVVHLNHFLQSADTPEPRRLRRDTEIHMGDFLITSSNGLGITSQADPTGFDKRFKMGALS